MKIAVWHNLSTGGGKRALHAHVRGLVERGHQVRAWTFSEHRDYLPLDELVEERVISTGWAPRPPGRGPAAAASGWHNRAGRLRAFVRAARRTAAEIDAGGFDLVFANTCEVFGMPLLMRHLRTPSALYLQEPYRGFYEARPFLSWVGDPRPAGGWPRRLARSAADAARRALDRAQAREEWLNAHAAGAILVNSFYSRESVLRAYARDARVCYLGIDTALFRPLELPRERFVVGLGAFDPLKGVELAVRAVALLPGPRPPLVWAADRAGPAYLEEMGRLAAALGVDLQVRQRLPDAALVETLNRASAMVYAPSLEPFGLAPLEAAACGTPVVAVGEAGVRETVRHGVTGLVVQRSADELAAGLRRLLDDPALARRLGRAGAREAAAAWSVGRSIDRLEEELGRARREAA